MKLCSNNPEGWRSLKKREQKGLKGFGEERPYPGPCRLDRICVRREKRMVIPGKGKKK